MMWHDRSAWARERIAVVLRAVVPPRLLRRYRERESFRRRVHRIAVWSWVPVLGFSFVFTDSGLVSIAYRQVRIRQLQHELADQETQAARLEAEAERRTDDPATIERLARERYDMAFPGERIYRVREISAVQARRISRAQRLIDEQKAREEEGDGTHPPARPETRPGPNRSRPPRGDEADHQIASRPHR